MMGISIWQLLIILAIVVLLFGTKKLKGIGGDLGGAIKGFKKAINEDDKKAEGASVEDQRTADELSGDELASEEKVKSESK